MHYILNWIDRTSMYRVVLYVLSAWVLVAFLLSFLGESFLFFRPGALFSALITLFIAGVMTHRVWKKFSGAPAYLDSTYITILILFFLFDPVSGKNGVLTLALVAALAISSKYIIAWHRLHIFNPVALVAFVASVSSLAFTTWWIGTPYFFIPVLLGGSLIVQKIRRWGLVLTTLGSAFIAHLAVISVSGSFTVTELWNFWLSYPILFFAMVMVTEPLTTPAGKRRQLYYGLLIGVLSAIPFQIGPIYASLALTLLIANALFYSVSLRARITLTLDRIEEIAANTFAFHFMPTRPLRFTAGQYIEWTLPHKKADTRGIRRYFTIASAPTESEIILGVKVSTDKSSTFKQHLRDMGTGEKLTVTALHGDFVLPKNPTKQPLVFIAGGIGITPFRSQIKTLIDTNTQVNATLFYCNRKATDVAWVDVWKAATTIGLTTVHVLSEAVEEWKGERGTVTADMIGRYVQEPLPARYYISGPPPMVNAYKKLLKEMGVSRSSIVVDYFPGLA